MGWAEESVFVCLNLLAQLPSFVASPLGSAFLSLPSSSPTTNIFFFPVQTDLERPSLLALGSDKIWLCSSVWPEPAFLNGPVNCN